MGNRLHDFRRRPIVSQAEYWVEDAGPYIRFDWAVRLEDGVLLQPYDDLLPLGADRVARGNYSYHATVEGGPDIIRYGSPTPQYGLSKWEYDLNEGNHHKFHHRHLFPPFGVQSEKVQVLDREETPTLPEFVEDMLTWYHKNHRLISDLSGTGG
jgi:hypothetical protein